MIVSFRAYPPKNSKILFLLNLVIRYDKSHHHFNVFKDTFFVIDLISDNFWSKCEGVNGVSLFEMTIFMFVGGDIEY
jgi:hypothetical protein